MRRKMSGKLLLLLALLTTPSWACSRGGRRAVPAPTVKLAASALSMNPHYHGYAELSSPHPPSPEAAFANGHDYPHNNNNPALKECAGCGGKIVERFLLHALDRYWHHGCLKCTCCGQALADMGRSFYFKGGMILCKSDYTRSYAYEASPGHKQRSTSTYQLKAGSLVRVRAPSIKAIAAQSAINLPSPPTLRPLTLLAHSSTNETL
ncbi:unnamed protein product [Chilo suppressalis]|uniref:LIM zinc-binding domain-containing protein n=1 Tax=Chilo suppressalis TaxID=168631 RepID=A0ABN8B9H1_CHISP|nr:unnamed protein product [Chilo suppressalis]